MPSRISLLVAAKHYFIYYINIAAEPSPGFNFNIAMYGEQDEELDGTELAAEWAFSSLQKFGQEFLKKLRGKRISNKLLSKVCLFGR